MATSAKTQPVISIKDISSRDICPFQLLKFGTVLTFVSLFKFPIHFPMDGSIRFSFRFAVVGVTFATLKAWPVWIAHHFFNTFTAVLFSGKRVGASLSWVALLRTVFNHSKLEARMEYFEFRTASFASH